MLPAFFQKLKEFPEIMKAWGKALDDGETNIQKIFDNLFVQTCDAETIATYEELFWIVPQPGDTLEARRNRILNRLSMVVPFSEYVFVSVGIYTKHLGIFLRKPSRTGTARSGKNYSAAVCIHVVYSLIKE